MKMLDIDIYVGFVSFIPLGCRDQNLNNSEGSPKEERNKARPTKVPPNVREERKTCQPLIYQAPCTAAVGNKKRHVSHSKRDYKVGDVLTSRKEIVDRKFVNDKLHMQLIYLLKEQDGAWIKQSDGRYTFAIVAKRRFEPQDDGTMEEMLVFKVNSKQSKKSIPKRLWGSYIKLPSSRRSKLVGRSARAASCY